MPLHYDRTDHEYVGIPAEVVLGGVPEDLTTYTCALAFMLPGTRPTEENYGLAIVDVNTTVNPPKYKLMSIPPDDLPGGQSYGIWARVTKGLLDIRRLVDTLIVD